MGKNRFRICRSLAVSIVIILCLNSIGIAAASDSQASFNAMDVINELAREKYTGRQSGTEGYNLAVGYLEDQMESLGIIPLLNESTYKQSYKAATAVLKSESVKVNGAKYTIMKDYMPFGRTSSGTFSFTKLYYAGSGQESEYASAVDGVVIFNWLDKNGKFPEGVADRILRAKQKGAKAVLVVSDGELAIGNCEHPLSGENIGIPVIYISKVMAQKALSVPDNFTFVKLPDKKIEISFNIERESAQAYNLVGVIPGKREDKAILVTTNIDGFGSLPDGTYYQSAKAGAAAAAVMLDLANYYKDNVPEYNIIIAMVGSKWTDQSGIKALTNAIDFNQIACTIDLYAMGGSGASSVGYTDQSFADFAKKLSPWAYFNNDLGNSLSGIIKDKTKRLILVRDSDTWVDDSMTDTAGNISASGYKLGLEYTKKMISDIIKYSDADSSYSFDYDTTNVKSEYFKEAGRDISYIESKYFKVYFDNKFKAQLNNDFLKNMDTVYERISKYNYYPYIGEKVKALFLEDNNEAAKIAGRSDLVGQADNAGGGFASFSKPVIYCRGPALGTVAHELNHLLAIFKAYGKDNPQNQECQGQSFLVHYNGSDYVENASVLINSYLQSFEAPKVIENARNYKTVLNWEVYTKNAEDPDGWQNSYHTLGSMYSFIKYAFGGNAARRAIYRVYDDRTKITSALCRDTGMNIDTFLEAWSYWMTTSGGTDDNVKSLIDSYTDNVNQYDYSHIYTTAASGQTDGGNSGSSVSRDNSITFNGKLNLAFDCTINSSDLFLKHLAVNKSGSDFIFTLDYESSAARMFSFFVPMSDSAIYLNYDSMKPGSNIIQFKIPISKLSNIDRIEMLFSIPRKAEKSSWLYFDTAPLKYLCPNKSDKKYDIDVMLNGAVLRFDQPPAIIGGKTLVPFRKIFESLGATVGWDKATKTASGAKGNINVSLKLGSTTAYVNGKPMVLEVPATSVNGSTMVPARFVAETLGAYVDWDKDTKTVIIVD